MQRAPLVLTAFVDDAVAPQLQAPSVATRWQWSAHDADAKPSRFRHNQAR
jgi:hypothetical protein